MEREQKSHLVPRGSVCYNDEKRRGGVSYEKEAGENQCHAPVGPAKIAYEVREYPHQEGVAVDGVTVAQSLGQEPGQRL